MIRQLVEQLSAGDSVDQPFLLTETLVRVNRQGAPYMHLELRDRSGTLEARFWNMGEEFARRFRAGDFVLARGKVQAFQGSLQLILSALEPIDSNSVDPSEFLPPAAENLEGLFARLKEVLMSVREPHLRALAECFLIDEALMRKFRDAPAGVRVHHAYRGGLLEHVVTMMNAAQAIVPLYPQLDRDLLILGIFLHDVGKIDELTYAHTFGYSDEGQLVGHLVLGVGILREKVARAVDLLGEPFPDELRLRLEHMIVSHHGSLEHGSPKVPMTPEAVMLFCLDTLDSKFHAVARELRESKGDGGWTAFNPSLNRRLFRGNGTGQDVSED